MAFSYAILEGLVVRFSALTAVLCIAAFGAQAQTLTRAETIADVSAKIGEIQASTTMAYAQYQTGQVEASIISVAVKRALTMAMELRDELSTNPYIRVSGVSVGFPAGVSVELEFPAAVPE